MKRTTVRSKPKFYTYLKYDEESLCYSDIMNFFQSLFSTVIDSVGFHLF